MSNNKPDALVYLVDDEFAVRDSLTLLIESTGQAVRSFASAEAFLNNYDPEQPGCLLLDVRMPSMSGLELQGELLSKRDFYSHHIYKWSCRNSGFGKSIQSGRSGFSGKTI